LQEVNNIILIAKLRPDHDDGRAVAKLAKLPNSFIASIYPSLPRNDKFSVMHLSSTATASIEFVVCMHLARFHGIEDARFHGIEECG
jgi:hypothetical protein